MAIVTVKKSFNLLKPVKQPPTFWEKVYFWMSGTARVIIILVSLVVIVVFGFRFVLDRQANDLRGAIKDLNDAINSYKDDETAIRALQTKTNSFSSIWEFSSNLSRMVPDIFKIIPAKLTNLKLGLEDKSFTLSGIATRDEISLIENTLKSSIDLYKNVQVSTLKKVSGQSNQALDVFDFKVTAEYAPDLARASLVKDNITN